MAESLEGRIALITGAARGMGRAIADVFAREGAAVGLLDVQEVELQQVVEGIRADGGKVIGQVADVRSSDQVEAAVQAVVNQLGPIDILVNSAGLGMPGPWHPATRPGSTPDEGTRSSSKWRSSITEATVRSASTRPFS